MKKVPVLLNVAATLLAISLFSGDAYAGVVSITNNFAKDVRAGLYAGASVSEVTVYAGNSRTYSTFANKSIDKISVVNITAGPDEQPYTYTVNNPSASTNFNVLVDTKGAVSVTPQLIPAL